MIDLASMAPGDPVMTERGRATLCAIYPPCDASGWYAQVRYDEGEWAGLYHIETAATLAPVERQGG